jgi:hypothetical protein
MKTQNFVRVAQSRTAILAAAAWLLLGFVGSTSAHHSYAMFDGSKIATVSGTVAKLEWANPHVFIWVYVPNSKAAKGYDLYAFENGSTNVLARRGWSKTSFKVGEKLSVDYWPLRDGRTGGHFIKATHEDGHVTLGVGGPNGANAAREAAHGK